MASAVEPVEFVALVQSAVRLELRAFAEDFRTRLLLEIEKSLQHNGVRARKESTLSANPWQPVRHSEPNLTSRFTPSTSPFMPLLGFSATQYVQMIAEGSDPEDVSGLPAVAPFRRRHSSRTSFAGRTSLSSLDSGPSLQDVRPGPAPNRESPRTRTASTASCKKGSPEHGAHGLIESVAEGFRLVRPFGLTDLAVRPDVPPEEHPTPGEVPEKSEAMDSEDGLPTITRRVSLQRPDDHFKGKGERHEATTMERALSLAPSRTVRFPEYTRSRTWTQADRFLRSARFEFLAMTMICGSAVSVGLETSYMTADLSFESPVAFHVADLAFCAFFCCDLILRIYVLRGTFFQVWGWGWNVFDSVLVFAQVLEEVFILIGSRSATAGLSGLSSSFLLRFARIMRAFRAVRVLHVMRFTEELRLLVGCVVYSLRSFFWACVFLSMMIYIASLSITQTVLVYRIEADVGDAGVASLVRNFGSLPKAALSIFQGLTGGLDWHELVDPLIDYVSPFAGILFCLFIAFALLAVLNVVGATFIDSVIQRAAHVKEIKKLRDATRLFQHIDLHGCGFIEFDQIVNHLDAPEVQTFFKSIDVDVAHAQTLFDLLDVHRSGVIELDHFLSGCIRLQGPAKAIDLVMFMRDLRALLETQFSRGPRDQKIT